MGISENLLLRFEAPLALAPLDLVCLDALGVVEVVGASAEMA